MATLCEAIARVEGFYTPGSRPNRNNNPGDIEWGKFAAAHGATRAEIKRDGSAGRFAFFPDLATGFRAMTALLRVPAVFELDGHGQPRRDARGNRHLVSGYLGATVVEALNHWAPPVENDVSAYTHAVCANLGCLPTTPIAALLN